VGNGAQIVEEFAEHVPTLLPLHDVRAEKSISRYFDRFLQEIAAVLRAGEAVDIAAINQLGESVRCTPAIANHTLFVRSAGHLWSFREPQPAKP